MWKVVITVRKTLYVVEMQINSLKVIPVQYNYNVCRRYHRDGADSRITQYIFKASLQIHKQTTFYVYSWLYSRATTLINC